MTDQKTSTSVAKAKQWKPPEIAQSDCVTQAGDEKVQGVFPVTSRWLGGLVISLILSVACRRKTKLNTWCSTKRQASVYVQPEAVFLVRLGTSWEQVHSQVGTSSQCFSHIPRSQLGTSSFSNWLKIRPQDTKYKRRRGFFPLLSADFTLFNGNMDNKMPIQLSVVIRSFIIRGIVWERNLKE